MNDSFHHQYNALIKFIADIESTPNLRMEVSRCKSSCDIAAIAGKRSIYLSTRFIRYMKKDLGACYWPWSKKLLSSV